MHNLGVMLQVLATVAVAIGILDIGQAAAAGNPEDMGRCSILLLACWPARTLVTHWRLLVPIVRLYSRSSANAVRLMNADREI